MILVDTSVWIDYFRTGDAQLKNLLIRNEVCLHPMIMGELACGNFKNRAHILALLNALPTAPLATHSEVIHMIEQHQLMGKGIGFIDAHLIAACMLGPDTYLWTRDARLESLTNQLHLTYQ